MTNHITSYPIRLRGCFEILLSALSTCLDFFSVCFLVFIRHIVCYVFYKIENALENKL